MNQGKHPRRRRGAILLRGIGIGIFVIFVAKADWPTILRSVWQMRWSWIPVALLLQAFMLFAKGLRWWCLLRAAGLRLRLAEVLRIFLAGFFCGVVTPGRLGEFIRIGYLKQKTGCTLSKGLLSVLLDRVLDLVFLGYWGLAGLACFGLVPWYGFGAAGLLGLAAYLSVLHRSMHRRLAWGVGGLVRRFSADCDTAHLERELTETVAGLQGTHFVWVAALTVTSNAVGFFGSAACLAKALDLDVSYFLVSAGVAINGLLAVLPITVGGLGTREAVFYYVFGHRGIGMEGVVAFCALNLVFIVLAPALFSLPFFLYWTRTAEPTT